MVVASFVPSEYLIESAARAIGKEQRFSDSYSLSQRTIQYLAPHFIKWIFPVLVTLPTIVIFTTHSKVGEWMALYLVIVSWLSGSIAQLAKDRRNLRPLMLTFLGGLSPIVIRLTEKGIDTEFGETASQTPWRAITKVLLTENLVLLLMKNGAFYIPFAAFPTSEERHDFVKFAASMMSIYEKQH